MYLRANGHVRLLTFSTRKQIIGSGFTLCFLIWVAVASVHFFDRDARLAAKEQRLEQMMKSYQTLHAEMQEMQENVLATARRLDKRQDALNNALTSTPETGLSTDPAAVILPMPISGPQAGLTGAQPESHGFFSWLTGPARSKPVSLDIIEADLADIEARQKDLAERMIVLTDVTLGSYDKLLRQSGLSKSRLLRMASSQSTQGQGGPYIADDRSERPAATLLNRRTELRTIDRILANTPFIPPIDVAGISSGYGGRIDPFNGHSARHGGLDLLPADLKKPILVQASGTVLKAGWNGAYGRFVEVDHGNGFVTRYGHMRKILVKAGQKVDVNSPIGYVGSSGRSTGPHLQYEIWFDGHPLNPLKIFKVADDIRALRETAAGG